MKHEDAIELIEVESISSTSSFARRLKKSKSNKIGSPQSAASSTSNHSSRRDVSHLFVVEKRPTKEIAEVVSETAAVESLSDDAPSDKTYVRSAKSDTQSYRHKLRERFNTVKVKTEMSVKETALKTTTSSLYDLSKTKSDADGLTEQDVVAPTRTHHVDPYKFFCGDNGLAVTNQGETETVPQLTETITSEGKKGRDDLLVFVPPVRVDSKALEDALYWKPMAICSGANIQDGDTVLKNCNIFRAEMSLLRQRLLKGENHEKWLDSEGNLKMLGNPCVSQSYRPCTTKTFSITKYVPATVDSCDKLEEIVVHRAAILYLHLFEVKFKYHPLFSVEHLLVKKLNELYDVYEQNRNKNLVQNLSRQLESLRAANQKLQPPQKYSEDIENVRTTLFDEGKNERQMLLAILDTWKAIKKLRKRNGYSSTTVKLAVIKFETDKTKEQAELAANIEQTYTEVVSEMNADYERKLSAYKHELQIWKDYNNSDDIKHDEPLNKPKKPDNKLDESTIRRTILQQFKESFKSPGEPVLQIKLTNRNEITPSVDTSTEKLRRSSVNSTKIYLKIFSNDNEVCKTKSVSLNDDFTCDLNEFIRVQYSEVPENLTLQFFEQSGALTKRHYSDCQLTVPESSSAFQESNVFESSFRNESEIIQYKHDGIGSGVNVNDILDVYNVENKHFDDEVLYTKGLVSYNIGWEKPAGPQTICKKTENKTTVVDFTNKDGSFDMNKLVQFANERNFEEENTKIKELHKCIRNIPSKTNIFRLNPFMKPLQFCDFSEIENNVRLQVLELRNKSEPEFVGMIVPNRLKEIPVNLLQEYKHRKSNNEEKFELDEDATVETKRSYCRRYLNRIYMKVFQQCHSSQNNLLFEDVLDEKYLAHFQFYVKILIFNVLNYFKLQPYSWKILPKLSKPKTIHASSDDKSVRGVKIVVSALSGMNLPQRSEGWGDIKPFLEVSYRNFTIQSSTTTGCNPVWNQDLVISLESSHTDYLNPDSLNDYLFVNVFDNLEGDEEAEIINKKFWLGSVEIPISALCYSNNMEGLFRVKVPHITIGYEQSFTGNLARTVASQINIQHTCLILNITMKPNVPKLSPSLDEWPTCELPYIKHHISKWNETYNNNFTTRRFSVLVIGLNGKSTCITRYIRPLDPPQLHEGFDVTADQCARYVSMIPFTNNNKFYQNVCLTTTQLLRFMIGSAVDHAIALTCYLLSLNLDAWLLFGCGIPDGVSAYVLLKTQSQETNMLMLYVYDVVNGHKYNVEDVFCPVQKIFCLVNEHNVLANVQRNDFVRNARFDFTRRSDWLPLFDDRIPSPSNSLQQKLVYVSEEDAYQLQMKIDRKLRKKFMRLRKLQRTIWNREVSSICRAALKKMEYNCMQSKSHLEVYNEVCRAVTNYRVVGCVVNLPFTTIASIFKRVESFGLHLKDDEGLEFAFSVCVHSYPSEVLVVWLFIGTIASK